MQLQVEELREAVIERRRMRAGRRSKVRDEYIRPIVDAQVRSSVCHTLWGAPVLAAASSRNAGSWPDLHCTEAAHRRNWRACPAAQLAGAACCCRALSTA